MLYKQVYSLNLVIIIVSDQLYMAFMLPKHTRNQWMQVDTSNFTNASITIAGAPTYLPYYKSVTLQLKETNASNNIAPNIQHQKV